MTQRRIFFSVLAAAQLLCCLPVALRAQEVFTVEEISRNSGKAIPLAAQGIAIVDINSKLRITPNRDAIRLKAIEAAGKMQVERDLRDKTARIEKVLRDQAQIVRYIQKALDNPEQRSDSLLVLLRRTMREIGTDSMLRSQYNLYSREFSAMLQQNPSLQADRFLYILSRYSDALEQLNGDMAALEGSARVQFSLRAFRKDKSGGARLHIENFDLFEQGEFFNVSTWVLAFSPDQMQQMQAYRSLADTLNLGAEKALSSFKNKLHGMLPALDCIGTMPAELRQAAETVPADVRMLLDQGMAGMQQQIDQLKSDLIASAPGDPFDAVARVTTVRTQLDTIYQQTLRGFAGLPQTNPHLNNIRSCVEQTRADVAKILAFVTTFPSTFLQKTYLASDELDDEVLAFDLDKIPEVGTLDLPYTGRREVGDELLIQALFVPKDDTLNRRQNFTVIAEREAVMIQVGAHSTSKIGIIMANPYNLEQQGDASKFRFTPSAALLLKFGSRRSHFYNKFLDPAIGLVTSSPDFDRDGVPEFATGLVGTIFHDILSFGWSWNFGADRPFYFVGVHLPFSLPGLPVNAIK